MQVVNQDTINLVEQYEGLRLNAYPDPASGGEPITIGYGTTIYPNGNKVKLGDTITPQQALVYFTNDLNKEANLVASHVTNKINANQLGALASFSYNEGIGNLISSTLLKKVNANPNDVTIRQEFQKWDFANGHQMDGLLARRNAEANLYFKTI